MFHALMQTMTADPLTLHDWLPAAILAGIAILTFFLRQPLAKALIYGLLTRSRRHHPEDYQAMRKEMSGPLALLVPMGFLTAACHQASFISSAWQGFLIRMTDSLFTGIAIWLFFKTAMVIGVLIMRRPGPDHRSVGLSAVSLLVSMIRIAILFIGVFIILSYWVTNVAGLVTGLGIGGLALTLAAQDTIGNFIGSLVILFDQPFNVGDWISCQEAQGEVEAIGIRSSRLRAASGALISLPNKILAEAVVTNETSRVKRRIELSFTLPWQLGEAGFADFKARLLAYLSGQDSLQGPLMVVVRDLTKQGMEVYVSCYTGPDFRPMMEAREGINREVMALARDMGFSLAIAQVVEWTDPDMLLSEDEK